MAGAAPEGNQYDERRYDSKMTELLGDGDDFFTSYDEVCDSFDALGLQENLLRGIYAYGWWYGVVGHLEACNANESHCQCHNNDTVVLEFEQYAVGSRWRRASVARKGGEEEGNRVVGFYGGFRKLYTNEDVALWERFRPPHILE